MTTTLMTTPTTTPTTGHPVDPPVPRRMSALRTSLRSEQGARALLLLGLAGLLLTAGAMNGATLTTSAFDTVRTWIAGLLGSTYVLAIGSIVMVAGIWQAKSGKGWTILEGLLVILVIAFVIPPMFTSAATATRSAEEIAQADRQAMALPALALPAHPGQ